MLSCNTSTPMYYIFIYLFFRNVTEMYLIKMVYTKKIERDIKHKGANCSLGKMFNEMLLLNIQIQATG